MAATPASRWGLPASLWVLLVVAIVAAVVVPAVSRRRGRTLLTAWDDVLLAPAGALAAVGPAIVLHVIGGLATSLAFRTRADTGARTGWTRLVAGTGRDAVAAGVQVLVVAEVAATAPEGPVGMVLAVSLGLLGRWLVEQALLAMRGRASARSQGIMRWFVIDPLAEFAPVGLAVGALVGVASDDAWATALAAVIALVLLVRSSNVEGQRDHNERAAGVLALSERIVDDMSREDMLAELVAAAADLWPHDAVAIEAEKPAPGAAYRIVDPHGHPQWLVLRRPDGRTPPDGNDDLLLSGLTRTVNGSLARLRLLQSMRDAQTIRAAVLAAVAHDIRGPLVMLTGGAATLRVHQARLDDDQRKRLLAQMEHAGQRMRRLVDDLLDLERLNLTDHQALTAGSCEPLPVVHRVVEDLALDDRVQVHGEATGPIEMPEHLFARVIENLISNASEHSPAAAPITVSCRTQGNEIVIQVDDQGAGVPIEARTAIFAAFEQLDDENMGRGVGLGLYVVGRFVRACNGRVWVTDSPTGGASFRLALPAETLPKKPGPRPPAHTQPVR